MRSVESADVDSDGDQDVVYASSNDDTVAWHENTDGLGTFGPPRIISPSAGGARDVAIADVNGDGSQDVFAALFEGDVVVWYPNSDGQGNFGAPLPASSHAIEARSVSSADFDLDGDQDVLYSHYHFFSYLNSDNKVKWGENLTGQGYSSSSHQTISSSGGPESVHAADVDGDGHADVIAALAFAISWHENLFTCQAGSDCDGDGTSDCAELSLETQLDCDEDGLPDDCQLVFVPADDCDANGLIDSCEIDQDPSLDCDGDGALDQCQPVLDCNGNGLDDCVEVASGASPDCNANGVPDECDVSSGASLDCNGDVVPDECQFVDCNGNGVMDLCEIASGASPDCNGDGVPDDCQQTDCNANGVSDVQDICGGFSADDDANGTPDECDPLAPLESLNGGSVSVGAGGDQRLLLFGSALSANRLYLILGSQSGIAPGIPVGPHVVPLNLDSYFGVLLANPNPGWLPASLGYFSPASVAVATLTVPAGLSPCLVGTSLHHAFVVLDLTSTGQGSGELVFASNPLGLLFTP